MSKDSTARNISFRLAENYISQDWINKIRSNNPEPTSESSNINPVPLPESYWENPLSEESTKAYYETTHKSHFVVNGSLVLGYTRFVGPISLPLTKVTKKRLASYYRVK